MSLARQDKDHKSGGSQRCRYLQKSIASYAISRIRQAQAFEAECGNRGGAKRDTC
jgi:hypothetical protein